MLAQIPGFTAYAIVWDNTNAIALVSPEYRQPRIYYDREHAEALCGSGQHVVEIGLHFRPDPPHPSER